MSDLVVDGTVALVGAGASALFSAAVAVWVHRRTRGIDSDHEERQRMAETLVKHDTAHEVTSEKLASLRREIELHEEQRKVDTQRIIDSISELYRINRQACS